jgi:hypothetical protein
MGLNEEHPEVQLWPEVLKPTERVGASTLLFYIPPDSVPAQPVN